MLQKRVAEGKRVAEMGVTDRGLYSDTRWRPRDRTCHLSLVSGLHIDRHIHRVLFSTLIKVYFTVVRGNVVETLLFRVRLHTHVTRDVTLQRLFSRELATLSRVDLRVSSQLQHSFGDGVHSRVNKVRWHTKLYFKQIRKLSFN